jgi:outer membrane protein assembly factor BamA
MKKQSNRFGARTATAVAAMFLAVHAAWALEPFKVQDIRVEGLQRVEPGTVFASIPLRVGDTYDDEKGCGGDPVPCLPWACSRMCASKSVGDVLVVVVEERPTVADVDFSGAQVSSTRMRCKQGHARHWADRRPPLRQGPDRPCRAGAQAPVHQQEPSTVPKWSPP